MPIPALFLGACGTAFRTSCHASSFYLSLLLIVATSFHSSVNVFNGYFDFKSGKYTGDEGRPNYGRTTKEELKFPSRLKRPSTHWTTSQAGSQDNVEKPLWSLQWAGSAWSIWNAWVLKIRIIKLGNICTYFLNCVLLTIKRESRGFLWRRKFWCY